MQISEQLRAHFSDLSHRKPSSAKGKMRRSASTRINEGVKALALCHNVTPVFEADEDGADAEAAEAEQGAATAATRTVTYQGRYSVLLREGVTYEKFY